MYVGTHYNSYYNSLFGAKGSAGSVYGASSSSTTGSALLRLQQQMGLGGSKNTGVYNQSAFGSDALKYVQTLKTAGAGLSAAIKGLSSGSAFRQQGAVSSDKSVLTVKDSGTATRWSQSAQSVEVDQIATAQVNRGDALQSSAASGISGNQRIAVDIGGKTSQISFTAKAGETNGQLQQRMADAINARGLGVTASVETDSKAGTSRLVLTGESTGQGQSFEVGSVSGGAFEALGVGQVSQQAQDAVYRLDGGAAKTSATNTINLGGGVTATLKAASDEAVTVGRGVDTDLAVSRVRELADQYNSLYGAALGNESDNRANRLFTDLVSNSRTYSGHLAKIGVGFDESGHMTLDEEKLAAAAEDGSLEQFFTENAGRSYGFQNHLARIAGRAEHNTNQYASATSFAASATGNLYSDSVGNSVSTLLGGLMGGSGTQTTGWLFDFTL